LPLCLLFQGPEFLEHALKEFKLKDQHLVALLEEKLRLDSRAGRTLFSDHFLTASSLEIFVCGQILTTLQSLKGGFS